MNIREVQTTGHQGFPVTHVYDGERFLGVLRNDGYKTFDGDWINDWVAFAGGNCVPMPGKPTDRATAKRLLLEHCSRASFAWQLAGATR